MCRKVMCGICPYCSLPLEGKWDTLASILVNSHVRMFLITSLKQFLWYKLHILPTFNLPTFLKCFQHRASLMISQDKHKFRCACVCTHTLAYLPSGWLSCFCCPYVYHGTLDLLNTVKKHQPVEKCFRVQECSFHIVFCQHSLIFFLSQPLFGLSQQKTKIPMSY